uniref:Resistance to inhibitors of cholinesterase protein 3 N-terminal domain-containing protein n=1 Tax=Anopheles arabiensis TaxID=7173 RepID=A0A182HPD4_ANOAR
MATATGHRMESNSGMGPRKTMIIMVTVVGCVAILWPKVFYPMMVGNGQNKNVIKDHRGAGCCGVVLDQETFANASINYASSQQQQEQQNLFRKRNFAPYVDIDSIRQERPPHLRPEAMHPAMRERGRAIPQPGSIHGGDRPQSAPRIVEGRPGPIPGMRPPMGAGSHQATKSANSMGFIMPLYTIGIVSFFIYTIMKLIFKKTPATPYTEVKPDPVFRNEVFTTEQYIKRPDDGTTKLDQSHATAATNGELVVPVSVSPVSNAVPAAEPASSVQSELTIDYEQLSKQKEVTKPDENIVAERIALVQEAASVETSEATETVSEECVEEDHDQQLPHDPTTEKVVDGIVVQKVVPVDASAEPSPRPVVDDIETHEPNIDSAASSSADDSGVDTVDHHDNGQIESEVIAEPAIEEVMVVQQVAVQNAVMVPITEDELNKIEQIDETEIAVEKSFETTETKQIEATNMFEVQENIQNEITQTEERVESSAETARQEEMLEIAPAVVSNDVTELPIAKPSILEEIETQIIEEQGEDANSVIPTDQSEHKAIEVDSEISERIECEAKKVSFEVPPSIQENEQTEVAIEQPVDSLRVEAVLNEEIVSEDNIGTIEQDVALKVENYLEEVVAEQQSTEQLEGNENDTALDTETSVLVHKTVEEITLTAEQLVQEVLEQAEELAKQQDAEFPELPEYDPATQKLVDGIVVERFDQLAATSNLATDPTVPQDTVTEEQQTAIQEQPVDELELTGSIEQMVIEEDAGEMDSISEDTSLSVASVIETQPKMNESEESNTALNVLKTAEEMTDSTSSEVAIVESKEPTVSQATVETVAAFVEQVDVNEPGNKFGAAVVDSVESNAVIEEQLIAMDTEQQATIPEALITTEVMTDSSSSEPVFVELNDQPTVEVETVFEGSDKVDEAGNLSGVAAADSNDNKSVSIEEVLDEAAIVDEVEGKVIEEHIIPISIEKASTSDSMTITEVTSDDAIVESPNISKTTSNMPSPLITAIPVMDTIDEKHESTELAHEPLAEQEKHSEISLTTLEHVTKEALVERTLNEAAAVVNEIESIVDHIITEKLIHSGASDAIAITNGVQESSPQEPPRLAASAALVVEAIESQSSGVHSMVSNTDSTQNMQTITVTNELSTNLDETIGNTNLPASDSLPIVSSSIAPASTPSSEAFPVPEPTTLSPSVAVPNGVSETQSINFVADEQRTEVTAGQGSTDADASDAQGTTSTVEQSVAVPEPESGSTTTTTTTTIGQVPTSVSNVTNPKFLTLNLANYSTSVSSGNNSKSSSLSIANLSQSGPSLAGGDSADQLMELELLRKKLDETERAMTKIIANMGNIPKGQETNVNGDEPATEEKETTSEVNATEDKLLNGHAIKPAENAAETTSAVQDTSGGETSSATSTPEKKPKKRDTSTERGTVKVMAMEVTAQRENGKRLSRPSTPLLPMSGHSDTANAPTEEQETRSIVLDGRLPHDSKILVSDAETAVEKMEPENSEEEDDAPVILSGKMTLSLINMDFIEKDATGTVAVGGT